uniref:Uncharacterized protein n=1 Tax=Micrurus corallinus TaxID=54390 RepID=A0A2D4H0T9_MICCO
MRGEPIHLPFPISDFIQIRSRWSLFPHKFTFCQDRAEIPVKESPCKISDWACSLWQVSVKFLSHPGHSCLNGIFSKGNWRRRRRSSNSSRRGGGGVEEEEEED